MRSALLYELWQDNLTWYELQCLHTVSPSIFNCMFDKLCTKNKIICTRLDSSLHRQRKDLEGSSDLQTRHLLILILFLFLKMGNGFIDYPADRTVLILLSYSKILYSILHKSLQYHHKSCHNAYDGFLDLQYSEGTSTSKLQVRESQME